MAGDETHSMQAPKVSVHERISRLAFVARAFGQSQMPGGVFIPGVGLQVGVFVGRSRLHVVPPAPEHILLPVDQPLRVLHRLRVDRVRRHGQILAARYCDTPEIRSGLHRRMKL
jgi:hypothetical protein